MSASKCHICGNQLGRSRRSWSWTGLTCFSTQMTEKAHHRCVMTPKSRRRIRRAWERGLELQINSFDPFDWNFDHGFMVRADESR